MGQRLVIGHPHQVLSTDHPALHTQSDIIKTRNFLKFWFAFYTYSEKKILTPSAAQPPGFNPILQNIQYENFTL